ncbi:hypothetical protein [Paludisphaera sp.]|uniref:hypothetical protein n=1 Tax=Paludisphaera sp. TaxID=2017432 RepID=UPI00301DCED3
MIGVWLLAACVGLQEPAPAGAGAPATTTADRVVLKDGRELLGLVTSPAAGPRVGFDMLVRREWAEAHVPDLAARWVRNAETMRRPAVAERRRRLAAWRAERKAAVGEDRVTTWIDAELRRMEEPGALDSRLLSVRIGRDGCRSAEPATDPDRRLLALAWTSNLPDPEGKSPDELRDAVEARGFLAEGTDFPSLDGLTSLTTEPESKWLARRAATELQVDPGRRFIRYQGLLLPEPADGGRLDARLDLGAALGQIGRLLDPDAGGADPLGPALAGIARQGGVGAVVTRLDMTPDLSRVGVEIALWVREPRGWVEYGARNAVVRPEDVPAGDAAAIGEDPQVKSVFNIAESLGLGVITPEMKERGLRMGAATESALGAARAAFIKELDALALPVLEGPAAGAR